MQLKDFEDQSKRKLYFPVSNSSGKVIGNLEMTVQYLYSLRQIYTDEIFKTQDAIKKSEEIVRQSEATIDTLYEIFPSEEKPNLNWELLSRMRRINNQRNSTSHFIWEFVTLGLIMFLVAVNLLFAIVEPNMTELALCLVFILQIIQEKPMHQFLVSIICLILMAKDVLYILVFKITDFTELIQRLDGGELILEIVRYAHIPAILLKAALIACVYMWSSKQNQNDI